MLLVIEGLAVFVLEKALLTTKYQMCRLAFGALLCHYRVRRHYSRFLFREIHHSLLLLFLSIPQCFNAKSRH